MIFSRRHRSAAAVVLAAGLCLGNQATGGELDPPALKALTQMGRFLHALPRFSLSAESETDQVLENGQVIEFHHSTTVLAAQPDQLYVSVDAGESARKFFYSGKTFTLYDSQNGYYTSGPAPASIDLLVDQLADRYGIELPLADLFRWTDTTARSVDITEALRIGSDVIADHKCTHYAYRQPGIDWQLWLRDGPQPLPCRLVIVRSDDPERPRHSVDFNWDLTTPIQPSAFVFTPPAAAHAVPLHQLQPGQPTEARP